MLDRARPGTFDHVPAALDDRPGEPESISARVELCLIVESDRPPHRERQRALAHQCRRQPEPPRHLDLFLDLLELLA